MHKQNYLRHWQKLQQLIPDSSTPALHIAKLLNKDKLKIPDAIIYAKEALAKANSQAEIDAANRLLRELTQYHK